MPPAFFVNQFWHIFDHMSKVTAKHENLKQPYLRILHGCTLAKITSKQNRLECNAKNKNGLHSFVFYSLPYSLVCKFIYTGKCILKVVGAYRCLKIWWAKTKTGEQYLDRFGEIQNYAEGQFFSLLSAKFWRFFFLWQITEIVKKKARTKLFIIFWGCGDHGRNVCQKKFFWGNYQFRESSC